jgi:hypothetical protein
MEIRQYYGKQIQYSSGGRIRGAFGYTREGAEVLLPRICPNTVLKVFSNSARPVARSGKARG